MQVRSAIEPPPPTSLWINARCELSDGPPDAYKMPNKPMEQFHCLADYGNIWNFYSLEPGCARAERIRKWPGKKSTNARKAREAF